MRKETVLVEARFDSKLPIYWMVASLAIFFFSVIGIPFIPIWLIIGWSIHKRQFECLSCSLTERSLNIKHGFIFRVEKSIPLDKIQDVGMKEGPLLRKFGLASLAIETAGQSNPQGVDASLVGIIDSPAFRDAILDQRELIVSVGATTEKRQDKEEFDVELLVQIRDSLQRIEEHMEAGSK